MGHGGYIGIESAHVRGGCWKEEGRMYVCMCV